MIETPIRDRIVAAHVINAPAGDPDAKANSSIYTALQHLLCSAAILSVGAIRSYPDRRHTGPF
jgi:hypothetical protein